MAIRCYIPTTLTALSNGLQSVQAVAPDAQGRSLSGEDFETQEFDALCIAAALAAAEAFERADESGAARRAVVAYDAAESSSSNQLTAGFDLLTLDGIDMSAVASIHLDEDEVWDEALDIAARQGHEAAEDRLGDSDLLWYDVTELPQLLNKDGETSN